MDVRRRGIIRINEDDLIRLFDLPLGYQIVGVYADYKSWSIDIMVSDDSLEKVAPGAEPPRLLGKLNRSKGGVLTWERLES